MEKDKEIEKLDELIAQICMAIEAGADDNAELEIVAEGEKVTVNVSLCDALKKLINMRNELTGEQ
jgi:hypothetical protein